MVQPVSSATTSIGTLPAPGPATERQGEYARWSAEAQRYAVDLSRNAYLLLVAATIATYLLLWLTHFQYVYGWLNDDRTLYVKGLATLKDWSGAFSFYNALQPYFFLISYLPLKLGVSLPSQPLPFLGEQTGQFRFLLLYTMLLHAVLLGVWAWFAPALTPSRLVAWLSLLLFATSPSLIFWSPQADSRVLGLPFLLAGLWLLVQRGHSQPAARWTTA